MHATCPICSVDAGDEARCRACGFPSLEPGHGPMALRFGTMVCAVLPGQQRGHGDEGLVERVDATFEDAGGLFVHGSEDAGSGLYAFVDLGATKGALERAVLTAARARDLVRHEAAASWEATGASLELRVGISSGLVLVEDGEVMRATSGGLVAALARHLAAAAGPDDVLLDEATARASGGSIATAVEAPLEAQGVSIPVYRMDTLAGEVTRELDPAPMPEHAQPAAASQDVLDVALVLGLALEALAENRFVHAANGAAEALDRAERAGDEVLVAAARAVMGHVYGTVETGHHSLKAKQLSRDAMRAARTGRLDHMEAGLSHLTAQPTGPGLAAGLAALFVSEYVSARGEDPTRSQETAALARQLLEPVLGGSFAARRDGLPPSD